MDIVIDAAAHDAILRSVKESHPDEACGLLLGSSGLIQVALNAANVHPEPARHFEIDPVALVAAHRDARAGGPEVLGYYHSHPNGLARPSETDLRDAAHDGRIWLIVAHESVTAWKDTPSGFEPLSYTLQEG
ncbi:M67 family metallopeptidase [Novosphingobium cyanobacteriorum]|uniref:M67 family metallopeptidase n=1 Tax=Novosphingobium cyanobacteriorum TaxID=3024215 RepID=A0ABT6CJX9_9SPHN|nr:M67 family metallopeptidase [Novosphingobium cyanobacteriorum]MDF8334228.1 M67 family metallopeptidase [Novosphingobium cyanobacteriorum]